VSVEEIKKYYNINEYTYSLVNNIICIYYYYGQRIKTNYINIYFMNNPTNVITNFYLFNLLNCNLDICFYKNINNAATKYYYCKYNYLNRYYYKYNKINTKIINLNQFYYLINKIYFIFYFYYIYI